MDFLVRRDDLRQCRFDEMPVPVPDAGEALLEIERYGLTSNNVTYAVMGDAMSYWKFFPAEEGWGRIPVWGYARVVASGHDDVPAGTRVYGYLPPSAHLLVSPDRVDEGGFVDATEHRASLPAVYNAYTPAAPEPRPDEEQQMLFRPLFGTSFLIDDFVAEEEFFGAGRVILSSASSKTALGTAFLLGRRDDVEVVGLTAAARAAFVAGVDVYDQVVTYDDIGSLADGPAVYVDMSGDAAVRSAVHERLGESLAYDCAVGASHWDRMMGDGEPVPGPAPQLFFAPDRFAKRSEDWGPGGLQSRVREAWGPFGEWVSGWLEVVHGSGPEDVERAYLELLDGNTPPSTGYVMAPAPAV